LIHGEADARPPRRPRVAESSSVSRSVIVGEDGRDQVVVIFITRSL
jgi:hypothetical protein